MHSRRTLRHTAMALGCAAALLAAPMHAASATGAVPAAAAKTDIKARPLILGVFPRYSLAQTHAMFAPLADRLARKLGREVRLETARDFDAFWQEVAQNRYDVMHYNAYHYVKAHRLFGHRAIARNEEGGVGTVVVGVVVRGDSDIERLTDLKGRTLLFGRHKHAMHGYIGASYLLRRAGLAAGDYLEQFARTPCDTVIAVYRRQAVAGSGPLACLDDNLAIDAAELKVLASSEPLVRSPWAVARSVSPALARRIAAVLTGLHTDPEGRTILTGARLSGIAHANDADYAHTRAIVAEVLHEHY